MANETCYGMQLKLAPIDNLHVKRAIEVRQRYVMPDANESDSDGAAIAEICRGWLETQGEPIPSLPTDKPVTAESTGA